MEEEENIQVKFILELKLSVTEIEGVKGLGLVAHNSLASRKAQKRGRGDEFNCSLEARVAT